MMEANGHVSLCVWDDDSGESYKLVGTAVYENSGKAYDLANMELTKDKPGKKYKGVVIFRTKEIYDAARGKNAGALLAGE